MRLEKPDQQGRFGEFGGRFAPETLIPALDELTAAFEKAWSDDRFVSEYHRVLRDYVGRPTPLHEARRISERLGVRILAQT